MEEEIAHYRKKMFYNTPQKAPQMVKLVGVEGESVKVCNLEAGITQKCS
jgi:hypothetical protein